MQRHMATTFSAFMTKRMYVNRYHANELIIPAKRDEDRSDR